METDESWSEEDWADLLLFLRKRRCTPFLGAGASANVLPTGSKLALEWAKQFGYPFRDADNLVRVAQFVAVERSSLKAKLALQERFEGARPALDEPNDIHRVIARFRLPVYITTNYDDFLVRAIEREGGRPRRVVCNWHLERQRQTGIPRELDFEPTPDEPVVFHLHGTLDDLESMVLTEDDYLDFLIYVHDLIPRRIERALADTSLLFLGYSFEDMNFKVLFRKLASYRLREGARHVAVQLKPAGRRPSAREIKRARKQAEYMKKQLRLMAIKVFWGSCERFANELNARL